MAEQKKENISLEKRVNEKEALETKLGELDSLRSRRQESEREKKEASDEAWRSLHKMHEKDHRNWQVGIEEVELLRACDQKIANNLALEVEQLKIDKENQRSEIERLNIDVGRLEIIVEQTTGGDQDGPKLERPQRSGKEELRHNELQQMKQTCEEELKGYTNKHIEILKTRLASAAGTLKTYDKDLDPTGYKEQDDQVNKHTKQLHDATDKKQELERKLGEYNNEINSLKSRTRDGSFSSAGMTSDDKSRFGSIDSGLLSVSTSASTVPSIDGSTQEGTTCPKCRRAWSVS